MVWLFEKSGSYTSKSGYALSRITSYPHNIDPFPWKKTIWNLKTSPKLRSFLWKIKSAALPVGSALLARGIQVDPRCKRCGEVETPIHLLLTCTFSARVWDLIPALNKPDPSSDLSISELLLCCTTMTNLPPTGLASTPVAPWVLWHLWKNRNQLVFDNKSWSEAEISLKVLKDARSWEEASQAPVKTCSPRNRPPLPQQPSTGYACFTDGAWDPISRNSGQGWVFHDPNGVSVEHRSSNRSHVASPLVAEALAVKAALLDAVAYGFFRLNIFSDSKSLVNLLNSSSSTIELHSLLFDIRVLSCRFEVISFGFIPRLNNVKADSLAKSALLSLVNPPRGE